jgi:hypothetical protein
MKNERTTIWKVVRTLNDRESNGGFWLPNIQRPFVWSEPQIEKLFDSIMREYPISTLLVWRTKSSIKPVHRALDIESIGLLEHLKSRRQPIPIRPILIPPRKVDPIPMQ